MKDGIVAVLIGVSFFMIMLLVFGFIEGGCKYYVKGIGKSFHSPCDPLENLSVSIEKGKSVIEQLDASISKAKAILGEE